MARIASWVPFVAGTWVVLSATGCGGQKLIPVKGIVSYDGKPLANASVTFNTQEPRGRDAHGSTDANGAFHLSTFKPGDGALRGTYKVTVQYSEPVEVPKNLRTAEDVKNAMIKASAAKKPSVVLPAIYCQPDQTILKHRVPEDGDAKLELKSAKS
jgi:hypothetical protein